MLIKLKSKYRIDFKIHVNTILLLFFINKIIKQIL